MPGKESGQLCTVEIAWVLRGAYVCFVCVCVCMDVSMLAPVCIHVGFKNLYNASNSNNSLHMQLPHVEFNVFQLCKMFSILGIAQTYDFFHLLIISLAQILLLFSPHHEIIKESHFITQRKIAFQACTSCPFSLTHLNWLPKMQISRVSGSTCWEG